MENNKPPEMDGALLLVEDDERPSPESAPNADGKAELAAEMSQEIVKRMDLLIDISIREDGDEVVLNGEKLDEKDDDFVTFRGDQWSDPAKPNRAAMASRCGPIRKRRSTGASRSSW